MPPSNPKSQLEESWVVEGEYDNESPEYSFEEEHSPPSLKANHRRATRSSNRSPEPELVMPSLDAQTLEASWADTSPRAMRSRNAKRPADKTPRPETSHQIHKNGSTKKQVRTKNPEKSITSSSSQGLFLDSQPHMRDDMRYDMGDDMEDDMRDDMQVQDNGGTMKRVRIKNPGKSVTSSSSRGLTSDLQPDMRDDMKGDMQFQENGSTKKRVRVKNPLKSITLTSSQGLTSALQPDMRDDMNTIQRIADSCLEYFMTVTSWLLEVLGSTLLILKKPISYLLAAWLLFGMSTMVSNLVRNSVSSSLSPICRMPGISYLDLPFCPAYRVDTSNGLPPPVEFDKLMSMQAKFEEVMEESASSVSLPMDMKRGEASIRDLRQLVRYSQLSSRNELILEFDGFIETARIASYDLQKFNSRVGRAVDQVIATTRWTSRVLDGIQEHDATRGSINSFINDKLLAPFQPVKFSENILLDQYIKHTRLVEEEIQKLISQAQALLYILNNLEDRLDVIHDISTRDGMHTQAMKDEVLSSLWAMVGGNRGKLKSMDRKLDLLRQLGVYRKNAMAHVSKTLLRLQAIGAGLEDLRERVGSPELLRDRVDIPLSVHLENIQLGIERLEEGRRTARKLEDEQIRKTLERGQLEKSLIDG